MTQTLERTERELRESQKDLAKLMKGATDTQQMLVDTLNVKLRYENIIKNLIANDEEESSLPVLVVIDSTSSPEPI